MDSFTSLDTPDEVAVIGMAGRFPKARTVAEFWKNLRDGVEAISFYTDEELIAAGIDRATLTNPKYVKAGALLEDLDMFDAAFFGFTPREAQLMDPQHRVFLECAWAALENAGYVSETFPGRIGVYAGVGLNNYWFNLYSNLQVLEAMGSYRTIISNDKDYLSTWVSYKMNLKGPSVSVQTACSTSLVAIHMGAQSLLNGECDIALAGGVSMGLLQKAGYYYQEGAISSPDGHCRAFDARAQGTITGSGVGIVVLKRLEDALADGDYINAVIKASAVNNDGAVKVGFTAPSVEGQSQVIAEAMAIASVDPATISYIEAHGTATPLGDPIEIEALTRAFRAKTQSKGFCAIGSVKTNIGHLDAAAGVAGFIKTVLALKHRLIPPSLHFESPNPQVDFASSPFYVNSKLSEWKNGDCPRRAGVSSFGIGGTNAHIILEEAQKVEPSGPSRPYHLLVLSARTASALETAEANLAQHLEENPGLSLADVAFTLQAGRKAFSHRSAIVARNTDEAVKALKSRDPKRLLTSVCEADDPPVAFMFAGQGTQYVSMALGLYESEPAFRSRVDKCCEMLTPHLGLDLRSVIYPVESEARQAAEMLRQTFVTQTALFVIEYALARLWMDWGVRPQAMIGHSLGEYVAACLAEVFPLEVALELVAARARLMQDLPAGAMLAVPLTEEDARPHLDEQISLAAINGTARCVFSGATASIERLEHKLSESGLVCRRLQTSHAFHSPMMDPALEPFIERVSVVRLQAPKIPFLSNVSGTWITAEEATDPRYWARHLRQPVRFNDGLDELLKEPDRILLEVAPGQTLAMLARQHPVAAQVVLSSLRSAHERTTDEEFLLGALGKLWLAGVAVRWPDFYEGQRRLRLPLPAYPFERKRYWIEAQAVKAQKATGGNGAQAKPEDSISFSIQQDAITVNAVGKEAPMNVEEKLMPVPESRVGVVRAHALEARIMSVLMTIVKDLTGIEAHEVDIQASFFDMGIDSLLLIQANQMVEDRLGVKISVVTLLEELETIQALADYVAEQLPAQDTVIDLLPHESGSYMPARQIEQESLAQSPAALMSAESVEAEDTQEKRVSVGLPDNGNGSRQPELQPARPEPARPVAQTQTPAAATGLPRHEPQVERAALPQPVAAISPARMHASPDGNVGNGKTATGTAIEWIVSQQLQIMSQQLNALRDSQGGAPVVAQQIVESQSVQSEGIQSQTVTVAEPPTPSVAAELPMPPVAAPPAVADIPLPSVKEGPDKIVPEPFLPYRPIKLEAARGISPALQQNMEDFINRYVARTQKSKRLTEQYRSVLADSRNSATFRLSWKELVYPIVGERSKGSRLWDVDGNEYVDIAMGFGVNLFGHSPAFISEAINSQLERGFDFGLQPHISFEAAQLVSELTGAERVNFCNSGTEAVMGALRIARTVTKRSKIALFSGSYHGWSDGTLARPITVDSVQRSVPAAPGVSPRAVEDVLVLDYDSPKSLETLKAHMHELAAVLVEPVQSRRPDLQPREFLHEVRRLTEEAGTVLIFDEMVTGFRIHPGGAQAWFGVKADLATYGKVVGGGMPIGVIAGKAACMDAFDGGLWNYGDASHPRADKTMFAGAFFKHPLTMAAAVAVLRHLKANGPALQNRLNERTAYMANDLNAFFKQRDLPIRLVHYGSLFRFMYPRELKYMDFLFYHLVERGVFASLEVGNCFLSTAHTDEDIAYVIRTVKESIDAMQSGGFLPGGAPAGGGNTGGGNTGRLTSGPPQSSSTGSSSTGSSQSSASVMTAMADLSPTASTVVREPARLAQSMLGAQAEKRVRFSLYYFGNYDSDFRDDKYDLLFEGARFADKNGFHAIWVPERHFHGFGGFSPNPSVIAAALARENQSLATARGQRRAAASPSRTSRRGMGGR